MDLLFFLRSYYLLEGSCTDLKRFFNICSYHEIDLYDFFILKEDDDKTYFTCKVEKKNLRKLEEIANRTNANLQFKGARGFYNYINQINIYRWFYLGAIMALFLLVTLSSLIWDIEIKGNLYYSDEKIMRYLLKEQIVCGMLSNNVSTIELSNKIRHSFPRVVWCSTELDGCKLVIHMKENEVDLYDDKNSKSYSFSNIVAEENGEIYSLFVRAGITDKKIGDQIEKDDILIRGIVPVKNDFDEIVFYNPINADGDIYIIKTIYYYDELKRIITKNVPIKSHNSVFVYIGNYRIELFPDKVSDNNQIISIINPVKLTNHMTIPIKIGSRRYDFLVKSNQYILENDVQSKLTDKFYQFCMDLEKKGVQIYENDVKIDISDDYGIMSGNVKVIKKIGISVKEVFEDYEQKLEE